MGSLAYVEGIKEKLSTKAKGRDAISDGKRYMLKESGVPYGQHFGPEMGVISHENAYFWNDYGDNSIG